MSDKPAKSGFRTDQIRSTYSIVAITICGLVIISAMINHLISSRQTGFLDTLVVKFSQMCSADRLQTDMAALVEASKASLQMLGTASVVVYALIIGLALYAMQMLMYPALAYIDQQAKQLKHMSATDLLTGLYNRAALFKVATILMNGAKRHKTDLCVLAIGIDELKKVNEAQGRGAGDAAIRAIGKALTESLRNSDAIGRVGGDEFAVFLPSTDEYRATLAAEKLRKSIEELPFDFGQRTFLLRISIGVAQMRDAYTTADDMLQAAELALQYAKSTGRNRIYTYSAIPSAAETT